MSNQVVVLRFSRHNWQWREQVLASPAAQRAREEGVILEPEWANGAKILASRISAADLIRSRIDLHPFHVILLQQDVEELKDWLSQLPYRQRPRVNEEQVARDIGRFDFVVENTFIRNSKSQIRSLSTCTASTQGYGTKNPRVYRPSVPSDATDGREPPEPKTLWQHAGVMKKLQAKRDIHGVLQCMSDIKRDGLVPDAYCYNIVINLHGKLNQLEEAERWFDQMTSDGIAADANTFAVLMDAYGIADNLEKAEWCLAEMDRRDLSPQISHYTILISAYARKEISKHKDAEGAEVKFHLKENTEHAEQAEVKFEELIMRGLSPTAHTFGAMIDMYAQLAEPEKAKNTLQEKLKVFGLPLDKQDYCMMVNAYANARLLDEALSWHERIKDEFGHNSIEVYDYTVLLKACARTKQLECACQIFREQLRAGIQPDHFNVKTLYSVGQVCNNPSAIRDLLMEMEIDTERLKDEFQAIGDEYNFNQIELNRKLWKLKEVEE